MKRNKQIFVKSLFIKTIKIKQFTKACKQTTLSFHFIFILAVKQKTQKGKLNHNSSEEPHEKKTSKEISITDVGGKSQGTIPEKFHAVR